MKQKDTECLSQKNLIITLKTQKYSISENFFCENLKRLEAHHVSWRIGTSTYHCEKNTTKKQQFTQKHRNFLSKKLSQLSNKHLEIDNAINFGV
ncbi:hypothetical protein RFI_35209, partial [Reticulomyxa filosa]